MGRRGGQRTVVGKPRSTKAGRRRQTGLQGTRPTINSRLCRTFPYYSYRGSKPAASIGCLAGVFIVCFGFLSFPFVQYPAVCAVRWFFLYHIFPAASPGNARPFLVFVLCCLSVSLSLQPLVISSLFNRMKSSNGQWVCQISTGIRIICMYFFHQIGWLPLKGRLRAKNNEANWFISFRFVLPVSYVSYEGRTTFSSLVLVLFVCSFFSRLFHSVFFFVFFLILSFHASGLLVGRSNSSYDVYGYSIALSSLRTTVLQRSIFVSLFCDHKTCLVGMCRGFVTT